MNEYTIIIVWKNKKVTTRENQTYQQVIDFLVDIRLTAMDEAFETIAIEPGFLSQELTKLVGIGAKN